MLFESLTLTIIYYILFLATDISIVASIYETIIHRETHYSLESNSYLIPHLIFFIFLGVFILNIIFYVIAYVMNERLYKSLLHFVGKTHDISKMFLNRLESYLTNGSYLTGSFVSIINGIIYIIIYIYIYIRGM